MNVQKKEINFPAGGTGVLLWKKTFYYRVPVGSTHASGDNETQNFRCVSSYALSQTLPSFPRQP